MVNSDIQSTPNHKRPGIAARAVVSSIGGAVLALAGCAAELDSGEPEIVEHSPEILGTFKTGEGVRLTFTAEREHDGGGDPVMAITEQAPIHAPSYLDHFRSRGATSLEAFLALAPEGTEAPALLRDAHAREAVALGRSAELRELSLDAVKLSATFDSATCDSYAAFTGSVSSWISEQTSSSTANHSLTFHGGGNVAAAMCNYDSNRVDYKYAQFCAGVSGGLLFCEAEILVPDGHRVNKTWLNATSARLVRAHKLDNYTLTVTSYIAIGGIPPVG